MNNQGNLEVLVSEVRQLANEVNDIKCLSSENRDILLGSSAEMGLVGKIAIVMNDISSLRTLITNDLAHIQAKMDIMFESRDLISRAKNEIRKESQALIQTYEKKTEEDQVRWSVVLRDWLKPVITALITAVLTYLIFASR